MRRVGNRVRGPSDADAKFAAIQLVEPPIDEPEWRRVATDAFSVDEVVGKILQFID